MAKKNHKYIFIIGGVMSGVGKGTQKCTHNVLLPISMPRATDDQTNGPTFDGHFEAPVVPGSEIPGLLGFDTCRRRKVLIDCNDMKMYMLGPGEYDLLPLLPRGTSVIQGQVAPSGHFVIPIDHFSKAQGNGPIQSDGITLSVTKESVSSRSDGKEDGCSNQ